MAFWAVVNGHAPSRIEPCLGMPSTIRDMWCMPEAGRILLDTNSIEASGPTPRRRNGPRSSSALSSPSVNRSGALAKRIANRPRVFMVLCNRAYGPSKLRSSMAPASVMMSVSYVPVTKTVTPRPKGAISHAMDSPHRSMAPLDAEYGAVAG